MSSSGKMLSMVVLAALLPGALTWAQDSIWKLGTGGASQKEQWSRGHNWDGGVPGSTNTAVFSSAGSTTVLVNTTAEALGLLFDSAAQGYTFNLDSTNTLTLHAGGINNQSSNTQTFNVVLNLAATQTWQGGGNLVFNGAINAGASTLTLSPTNSGTTFIIDGAISGTGGLVKSGAGLVLLSETATYSGPTTVNAGTLRIDAANRLPTGTSLTLNGGTFDLNGNNQTVNSFAGGSSATLALGSGTFTTGAGNTSTAFSGTITGTGGNLVKTGSGLLDLSGSSANTYTGSTTVSGGTVRINADNRLGTAPASPTAGNLVLNGGTLETTATMTLNANRGITLGAGGGTLTPSTGTTLTFGGVIAGSGSLTKTGAGTLLLSGSSTYTGQTNVNAGTLAFGTANALHSSNLVVTASGTIVDLNGFNQTLGGVSGLGTLIMDGADLTLTGSSTFSGVFSGAGTIIINSGASLTLGADFNNNSLNIVLNGGTLFLGNRDSSFGSLTVQSSSILDFGGGSSIVEFTGGVAANAQLQVQNWVNTVDFFYSSLSPGTQGASPLNNIVFTGFTGNDTKWLSYTDGPNNNYQVTPVPEPSVYGAGLMAAALGLLAWHRRRRV